MEERVIEIIVEILKGNDSKIEKSEISLDSNLRDLGLSSFDMAALTVHIEDEFDIDIFEEGLVLTVGEITQILKIKNIE